jgi:hypothetical protein
VLSARVPAPPAESPCACGIFHGALISDPRLGRPAYRRDTTGPHVSDVPLFPSLLRNRKNLSLLSTGSQHSSANFWVAVPCSRRKAQKGQHRLPHDLKSGVALLRLIFSIRCCLGRSRLKATKLARDSGSLSSTSLRGWPFGRANRELLPLATLLLVSRKPARCLSSPCPRLRGVLGIAVLRRDRPAL